ncbi:ATP-binding protein [Lentisphaerota bacterium WC36G]|nr:ATP-binding protein [Lentisphaerae bacterium WC36]UDQ99415.1 ATP-binding protein [Lentisphaerae bacterium WC36]
MQISEKVTANCQVCNLQYHETLTGDDGTDKKAIVILADLIKTFHKVKHICRKCAKKEQQKKDRQTVINRNLMLLHDYPIPFEFSDKKEDHFNFSLIPDGGKLANNLLANYRRNLYIANEFNSGKTRSIAYVAKKLLLQGVRIIYITANELLAHYSTLSTQDKDRANYWLKSITKCDLLIVDDLGKKKMTDSNLECFYELTNFVYTNGFYGGKMWLSANVTPKIFFDRLENCNAAEAAEGARSRLIRTDFKNPYESSGVSS